MPKYTRTVVWILLLRNCERVCPSVWAMWPLKKLFLRTGARSLWSAVRKATGNAGLNAASPMPVISHYVSAGFTLKVLLLVEASPFTMRGLHSMEFMQLM